MKKIAASAFFISALHWIGIILLPLALYILLLVKRLPFLSPAASQVRYGFSFIFPLVLVLFLLLSLLPARWNGLAVLSFTAALCAFALAGLWIGGKSEPSSVITGLIPYSDASRHYTDALAFQQGFEMSSFSAERPMFAVFLSALLGLSNFNLQFSVAVTGFLAALSIFPVARQLQRSHGALAGAFIFALLFFYYRRFIGTTLSESMGFILGNCGFALLWAAAGDRNLKTALLGLFVTAAALNARPGPMFLLPLFLLWTAFLFRGRSWISWRVLGAGVLVIAPAFLINSLISRQVHPEALFPFQHFTYALYGVVFGGVGFGVLAIDHPELAPLPDVAQAVATYRLIFNHLVQVPSDFLLGIWKEIRLFFSDLGYNMFSFLSSENPAANTLAFYGMYFFALAGAAVSIKKWKEPFTGLLAAGLIAILFSLPFARPSRCRPAASLRRRHPAHSHASRVGIGSNRQAHSPARIFNLSASFWQGNSRSCPGVGDYRHGVYPSRGIQLFRIPVAVPFFSCPPGQEGVLVRYSEGSFVRVIPENSLQLDGMPDFHRSRFRAQVHNASTNSLVSELENVESPSTVFSTINLLDGTYIVFVSNTKQLPPRYGVIRACGQRAEPDSENKISRTFFAKKTSWIQD